MLLVIDVGNSNVVCGGMENGKPRFLIRLATDRKKTGDEYALALSALLKLHDAPEVFAGVAIASVVPQLTQRLCYAAHLVTGLEPFIIRHGIKLNFSLKTEAPASLGTDLLADMAAARTKYPLPVLIFDLGTATTLSVLDRGGDYIGGVILPGPAIASEALARCASQLFPVDLTPPPKLLCGNTRDCLRSGAVLGHAAMLDGLADRAQSELGGSAASIVMTGGLAPVIAPLCTHSVRLDADLTLRGIAELYRLNVSAPSKR
ncbi:MAG: type III pantothenate kinase [Oscillospiraceae bacterium]|jgi:type III pantothenate kinase